MAVKVICGPKLSLCCMLISVWGIIMLSLLGLFYRLRSPALAEDLPQTPLKNGYSEIVSMYNQTSSNCFIAAGIYVATLAFSFIQYKLNQRVNYTMS